jgi:hypothetical protein
MGTGYFLTVIRHRRGGLIEREGPESWQVRARVRSEVQLELSSTVMSIFFVDGFVLDVVNQFQHVLFSESVHELASAVGRGLGVEACLPVWDAVDMNLRVMRELK